MFNKHTLPNLTAIGLILISLLLPSPLRDIVLSTGLFALSGALTNWLAVHMLFERVPGLYGSGVISLHFEEFKQGILRMVHEELLDKGKVEQLLSKNVQDQSEPAVSTPSETVLTSPQDGTSTQPEGSTLSQSFDLAPMLKAIDMDLAFDQLVATITESSFGGMLAMVGGESALQPLREPFKTRMQGFLEDAARSPRLQQAIAEQLKRAASSEQFLQQLDSLLKARLDELTPDMVKDIMQRMIRQHLGWLVVWGGVFGGLIGLIAGLLRL